MIGVMADAPRQRRDRSPFPGMDPYLDAEWPDIHLKLIAMSGEALNAAMPPDLYARAELQVGVGPGNDDDDEGVKRLRPVSPDVKITQEDDGGVAVLARPATRRDAVRLAPMKLRRDSPLKRRWLEIRDAGDRRLVTVVEFVSPANKRGSGRAAFHRKRRDLLQGRVNVVEIDLTRGGPWPRLFDDIRLTPAARRATYRTAIFVPGMRGAFEAWLHPMPLAEPLPAVNIPLRVTDEPVPLSLQPLIERAYHGGRYGLTLDYREPPEPPLTGEDAKWADELLKQPASTTA